jgi:hypothetical protein
LDKANFLYGAFTSSNASFTMITPLIVSIQRLYIVNMAVIPQYGPIVEQAKTLFFN